MQRVRVDACGPAVRVNYRMHQRDGTWLVSHLAIQGVGLVATYRRSFSAEINGHGLGRLIDRLGERRAGSSGIKASR